MGKKSGKKQQQQQQQPPQQEQQKVTHECHVCGKPAAFCCPKCKSLGLAPTYYCGAECQRSDWTSHKALHQSVASVLAAAAASCTDIRFAGYTYTGPLRKYPETPYRPLPDTIPRPDYAEDGVPDSEIAPGGRATEIKTPEAIEGMREACRVAREVLDIAGKAVAPGVTTDAIDEIVHQACIERGAYPSPLRYRMFPKSVCTSVNEVVCHGIPDTRPLEEGDIVNIDVTVYYKGYHGDVNETYPVGKIDDESKRLIQAAYDSMMLAIRSCKPHMDIKEIGNIIEGFVTPLGFVPNKRYCGHGIGKNFHTDPTVCHYANSHCPGTMRPGMIFTIEPMIQAGKSPDETWPDDWTVVTRDGKRSAQFEHTILMTETGAEILTARKDDSEAGMSDDLLSVLHRLQDLGLNLSDLSLSSDDDSDSDSPEEPSQEGDYTPEDKRTNDRIKELIQIMMENAARKLKPGDVCVWERGLQNRRWPSKGEPVVILEVLSEPLYATDERNSGSPYFHEPLDVRVMGTDPKRVYFLDSRRLRKISSCDD